MARRDVWAITGGLCLKQGPLSMQVAVMKQGSDALREVFNLLFHRRVVLDRPIISLFVSILQGCAVSLAVLRQGWAALRWD